MSTISVPMEGQDEPKDTRYKQDTTNNNSVSQPVTREPLQLLSKGDLKGDLEGLLKRASKPAEAIELAEKGEPFEYEDYKVGRKLGEGKFAYVVEAERDGKTVALKLPKGDKGAEALERHAEILSQLDHSNISRLVKAKKGAYVTEERGLLSLKERVHAMNQRDEKITPLEPLELTEKIAYPILDALAHAHKRGIVHRDVKPENIVFVNKEWSLTDFNVSDSRNGVEGTLYTNLEGKHTEAYASPEQRKGQKGAHRSDLYSFAVVLFEAITGELPEGSRVDANELRPQFGLDLEEFFKR